MLYEIRADRDVTSKGPEGSGTRRRTVKLPGGPMTLTIGAQPIYLNADVLPPEIATDEHLVTKAVTAESFDPGTTVIDLKAERVQEEMAAAPPDDAAASPAEDKLKAERVQNPTAVAAINKPKRR
ncbi:MAG TPA: hypothetical protein VEW48_17685 [Thermoanaerobaculia bacterium]|nr:hypothetical protein [Thermoanaerobaculia bacterium]